MRHVGRRFAGLAAIAIAMVLATGCNGGTRKKPAEVETAAGTATVETPAEKMPERYLRKPPPPPPPRSASAVRAEIVAAARQLMDAPPTQVWQAERRLVEMGSAVASSVRPALRSRRGEVRAAGARVLGAVLGANAARDLVPLLDDDELDVRYHTICVLRETTGHDFGYLHVDEPAKRADAVARWRTWLASYRGRRGTR